MANRIRRVSRFSTGTVDIHPQHAYRSRSPMYWWILTSRRWLEGRPINVYVIEHADGVVVFDTGQDRASVTDSSYFPDGANGVIYRRLARFHVSQDETMTAGLERLGYSTSDVARAVVSHLHQDHIGGIGEIPRAELLVSDDEWRSLHRPMPETRGLLRAHINLPDAKWKPITYEPVDDPALRPFTLGHDLFGDGSLMILPTPGHTPGSMSMFVRRSRRTIAAPCRRPHLRRARTRTRRLERRRQQAHAARHARECDGTQGEPPRNADPRCPRSRSRGATRYRDTRTRSRLTLTRRRPVRRTPKRNTRWERSA